MTSTARQVERATTHVIPQGPFARLGRWSARHRRWVIAVWIVVFLALAPLATQLSGRLSQGGFQISGSTSQNAINVVSAKFTDQFPASMTLVLTSPTLPPNDPAFEAVIAKAAAAAKKAGGPVVGAVTTPAENPQLAYPAARTALIQIGLTEGIDQVLAHTKPIIDAATAASTSRVEVSATGGPAIFTDFNSVNTHDLRQSETVQIPLILLVLVLFFGSLWAAGIPVVRHCRRPGEHAGGAVVRRRRDEPVDLRPKRRPADRDRRRRGLLAVYRQPLPGRDARRLRRARCGGDHHWAGR